MQLAHIMTHISYKYKMNFARSKRIVRTFSARFELGLKLLGKKNITHHYFKIFSRNFMVF